MTAGMDCKTLHRVRGFFVFHWKILSLRVCVWGGEAGDENSLPGNLVFLSSGIRIFILLFLEGWGVGSTFDLGWDLGCTV